MQASSRAYSVSHVVAWDNFKRCIAEWIQLPNKMFFHLNTRCEYEPLMFNKLCSFGSVLNLVTSIIPITESCFLSHSLYYLSCSTIFQISHKLQPILSPSGIYWGSLNESQTSEQSLSWLSGISLCTLCLAALFRFIWAHIRPENDRGSQRSLPSRFVGVWTSWAPLYSLAG